MCCAMPFSLARLDYSNCAVAAATSAESAADFVVAFFLANRRFCHVTIQLVSVCELLPHLTKMCVCYQIHKCIEHCESSNCLVQIHSLSLSYQHDVIKGTEKQNISFS